MISKRTSIIPLSVYVLWNWCGMQGALACMRFSGRGNRNWCGNICCTLLASQPPIRPCLPPGDWGGGGPRHTRRMRNLCSLLKNLPNLWGLGWVFHLVLVLWLPFERELLSPLTSPPPPTDNQIMQRMRSGKAVNNSGEMNSISFMDGSKRNWVKSEAKQFNWGKFTHYELKLNAKRITKVIYPARGLSFRLCPQDPFSKFL